MINVRYYKTLFLSNKLHLKPFLALSKAPSAIKTIFLEDKHLVSLLCFLLYLRLSIEKINSFENGTGEILLIDTRLSYPLTNKEKWKVNLNI